MPMKNVCPCKGCEDRTVTCHGVCKRYKDWKAAEEELRLERLDVKKQEPQYNNNIKKRMWKKMRWK